MYPGAMHGIACGTAAIFVHSRAMRTYIVARRIWDRNKILATSTLLNGELAFRWLRRVSIRGSLVEMRSAAREQYSIGKSLLLK